MAEMWKLFRGIRNYFKLEHALFLVPICGFALYDSVFQSFSSILGVLTDSYPGASVTTIQLIISIPPMASIPGTLLAGFLAAYIRKKRIAQFALCVIFVGGMIPVVFRDPTIYAMFACSVCVGLGQGLLHPMANAFICQTWSGDQRGKALGFKQSFNFIGDALVALCVGYLALAHWGNAFLVYLGVIPIFILTQVLFPAGELEKKLVSRDSRLDGMKALFRPRMVYLFVLFFFAMMFLYVFNTNIAMLVKSRGLGTTADVSKISFTVSIVSFLAGILYGGISKKLGRFTLATGFCLLASGMLVASFGTSLGFVAFGGVLFGAGLGIQQISTILYVSKTVEKSLVTIAISVTVSFISLGATLSPVVINGLQEIVFGATAPNQALAIAGVGYIVLMLVEGVSTLARRRNHPAHECAEDLGALDELDG